jgi:hypothetical protein
MILTKTSLQEAKAWFGQHHYTQTASGYMFFAWEIGGVRFGMVALGRGGNRFGVADKFGLLLWPGGLEITRVACAPGAPRNTASKMIAAALRELPGQDWVVTYADTAHGHHGGIYQALNAAYVGTDARQWVNFSLNGLRVSKRTVSGKYGHTQWPAVRDIAQSKGDALERVPWQPKHTYILNIARNKKVRRELAKHLAKISRPYPKTGAPVVPTPYRNHRPKAAT